jgi:hypothetical protein
MKTNPPDCWLEVPGCMGLFTPCFLVDKGEELDSRRYRMTSQSLWYELKLRFGKTKPSETTSPLTANLP